MRQANIPGTEVKSRLSGGLPAVEQQQQQLSRPTPGNRLELALRPCRVTSGLEDPTVPEFTSWHQLFNRKDLPLSGTFVWLWDSYGASLVFSILC